MSLQCRREAREPAGSREARERSFHISEWLADEEVAVALWVPGSPWHLDLILWA